MDEPTINLDQFKALLQEELTPSKAATSSIKEELTPFKEAITSMESKLGDHEASLEKVTQRLASEVLESAPADEKIKSAVSLSSRTK